MWVGKSSTTKVLATAALCLVALAACSQSADGEPDTTEETTEVADTSTETTPASTDDSTTEGEPQEEDSETALEADSGEEGFLEMIVSEPELQTSASGGVIDVVAEDSSILLTFEMGSQKCYGATATVEETDQEVVVDLRTGLRADATDSCVEGVYPYQVSVDLEAPVGDRRIRLAEPSEPVGDTIAIEEGVGNQPSVDHLLGISIEEGVQWAIDNEVEWHLESYDGVPRPAPEADDGSRLAFVAESDRITKAEWK